MTVKGLPEISPRTLAGLGREERDIPLEEPIQHLRELDGPILITGANGAIGRPLTEFLWSQGLDVVPTDIAEGPLTPYIMDVRDSGQVSSKIEFFDPALVIHLAASKLAPVGELDPLGTMETNALGTQNLLNTKRPLVLASTCKAGSPSSAYGASKLIAERAVLNAGGSALRYYNVPECGPSMLTIWGDLPENEPLPVTPQYRYIISLGEAIALTIWSAVLPSALYCLDPGEPVSMAGYAERTFPRRPHVHMEPRRGDREREPRIASHEWLLLTDQPWINRIGSHYHPADPLPPVRTGLWDPILNPIKNLIER